MSINLSKTYGGLSPSAVKKLLVKIEEGEKALEYLKSISQEGAGFKRQNVYEFDAQTEKKIAEHTQKIKDLKSSATTKHVVDTKLVFCRDHFIGYAK